MNIIGGANVVILKRPTIEEAKDNDKNYIYPVTAATQSQEKNLEAKKFHPTSRVTNSAGRNAEMALSQNIQEKMLRAPSCTIGPTFGRGFGSGISLTACWTLATISHQFPPPIFFVLSSFDFRQEKEGPGQ